MWIKFSKKNKPMLSILAVSVQKLRISEKMYLLTSTTEQFTTTHITFTHLLNNALKNTPKINQ